MDIKLKNIIESDRALGRLFSAHRPTVAQTFPLKRLRRAIVEHVGPDSAYAESRKAIEAKYIVALSDGNRVFVGDSPAEKMAAAEAYAKELNALLDEDVDLRFTPVTLEQLDDMKVTLTKPLDPNDPKSPLIEVKEKLDLSVGEIDLLAWLIKDPTDSAGPVP